MDIFFDSNEIRLPPDEIRIRELRAEPWPDGRRVRVYLEVDPFQKRPNADLVITGEHGQEVAHTNIIEAIERKIEITMHLRGQDTAGVYCLTATLFYAEIDEAGDPENASAPGGDFNPIERTVVDTAQASFEVPPSARIS